MADALTSVSLEESTARRFLKLKTLDRSVAETVCFGQSLGGLPFSSAAELTRLSFSDQRALGSLIIENGFTKEETREVVQMRIRGGAPVDVGASAVLKLRPEHKIVHAHIGAVVSTQAVVVLERLSQLERDELFSRVLGSQAELAGASGRLTSRNFTLVFDGEKSIEFLESVETLINESLERAIQDAL